MEFLYEKLVGNKVYRQRSFATPVRLRHPVDHKAQEQYEGSFYDDVGEATD